ncbi:MAG: UDP-N-acetylmuramoyl-L-alanine--D-glutamate ligase [Persephonella sp.]|nr:MAG: UDP-N-acetylmuramoyl-L-alanine--D-glutamate ligase [Persephonella sp.]
MLLIYGKGLTGNSAYNLAKKLGYKVLFVDDKDYKEEILKDVQEVVVSPGVPFFNKIYKDCKKKRINIIGEIEFAYRFFKEKDIVAITGTDGKSTTTKLIHTVLGSDNSVIGGNYGIPFSDIVLNSENKTAVLELSSFQIYSIKKFKPNIAVFLNLSVDHLDWHKRFCHYKLSKYKLFKNLLKKDIAILNYDDINVRNVPTKAKKLYFSLESLPSPLEGIYYKNGRLVLNINKKEIYFDISDLKLEGLHNIQNVMAAILTAYIKGLDKNLIQERLKQFKPLPFRMEVLGEIKGVKFVNDAKSTTVQSLVKALESYKDKNVLLILGGINKGGDFSVINRFKNIKGVFLIGRDKEDIAKKIKNIKQIYRFNSLEDAVKTAFSYANSGDILLFSPACASFDMFKNYKDRGERFKKIYEELKNA